MSAFQLHQTVIIRIRVPGLGKPLDAAGEITGFFTRGCTRHAYVRTKFGVYEPKVEHLRHDDAVSQLGRLVR